MVVYQKEYFSLIDKHDEMRIYSEDCCILIDEAMNAHKWIMVHSIKKQKLHNAQQQCPSKPLKSACDSQSVNIFFSLCRCVLYHTVDTLDNLVHNIAAGGIVADPIWVIYCS